MSAANSLLLEIQQAVGCPYLSDLHSDCRQINKQMRALLMEIPLNRYSLQEWNDAASYVTGESCRYTSAEEARSRITAGR